MYLFQKGILYIIHGDSMIIFNIGELVTHDKVSLVTSSQIKVSQADVVKLFRFG